MTSVATWEPAQSRVRLTATGLGSVTTTTWFSRPSNSNTWTQVRGGKVQVTGGTSVAAFDYEFPVGADSVFYAENAGGLAGQVEVIPSLAGQCWFKFPGYPYLNTRVYPVDVGPVQRTSRSALHDRLSASTPYVVQEFMTGWSYEMTIRDNDPAALNRLDVGFATGSIVFVHADPDELTAPSMYAVVEDVSVSRPRRGRTATRYVTVKLRQVARPAAAYAGPIGNWQSLLSAHTTWNEVVSEYATWADVLEITGSPSDVVVS